MVETNYFATLPAPWVIAEIGINHNGSPELARRLMLAAQEAGADMVKFQSFSAEAVACKTTLSLPHVDASLGVDGTIYTLLETLALSYNVQTQLHQVAKAMDLPWTSTPFSVADVEFLAKLDVPFIKIGSTDVTTPQMLQAVARTGKPILLSTGMATMTEVEAAVDCILSTGNMHLALMHCVSLYPPSPTELNLSCIQTLAKRFPQCVIGYSDHSIGTWATTAAVALGARIIEKHFTLDATMAGPDQSVSADPLAFAQLVNHCKATALALGNGIKTPCDREALNINSFRRSVVTTRALPKGTKITLADLTLKRPATGLQPAHLDALVGLTLTQDLSADEPISPLILAECQAALH
jgi:N,N'-diacetyllegionaminate synthase